MFSYLEKLDANGTDTAEYPCDFVTLPDGSHPVLIVRLATTRNDDFANAALAQANLTASNAKKKSKKKVTAALLKENRANDKKIYAKTVLVGWKGMVDLVDGKPVEVEYTPELGQAFIDKLPDHLFDELREWCADPANFSEAADIDLEALAGNS